MSQKGFPMALTTKIDMKKGYLKVKIEGRFDLPSAFLASDAMLDSIEKYKPSKVFMDFRKMTGVVEPMERFHYAEDFSKKYQERFQAGRIKHSQLVFLGSEPQFDPTRFDETVAVNRGVPIRSTNDPQKVWEWLGIDPEDGMENK